MDDEPRYQRQHNDLPDQPHYHRFRALCDQFEILRLEGQTQVEHQQCQYRQYNKYRVHKLDNFHYIRYFRHDIGGCFSRNR